MTTIPIDTLPVLDLNVPEFWQDIYTPLAEVREESPVAMTTDGVLYVLRHDEIDALLKDPRFLAADLLAMMGLDSGPVWSWWQSLMFSKNPPEHTRLRKLVSRAFTPRQIEKLRESIRATAESLVAPALEGGVYEVMEEAAHLLPSTVMADMLGIPAGDRSVFVDWTTDIGLAFGAATDPAVKVQVEAALAGLDGYVRQMIEQRRSTPGDDLLSQLLTIEEGSDRLTTDELVGITENLMFAGHDTTRGSVGVIFQLLAERPDVHADLFSNPDLVGGAVEELLRYEAITFSTSRRHRKTARSRASRSRRARRWESACRRPRVTLDATTTPIGSTSLGKMSDRRRSVPVCTSASARRWPGWSCRSCCRSWRSAAPRWSSSTHRRGGCRSPTSVVSRRCRCASTPR